MTTFSNSVSIPATDTDFLAFVSNESRKSVIDQTCQQTPYLARLLDKERRWDINFSKCAISIIVVKTVESCILVDGTHIKFAESTTYHPRAAEYYKVLAL